MDKLQDMTKSYMENVMNTMEKIVSQTNYGIEQLVNDKRNYTEGNINTNTTTTPVAILYGKPESEDKRIETLFEKVVNDINTDNNPILVEFSDRGYEFTPDVVRQLKENMVQYVKSLQDSMKTSIATILQELVVFEQDYVQYLLKCNVVNTKTDGKILDTGEPRIYSITETDKVSKSTTSVDPTIIDTYKEFWTDYSTIRSTLNEYNTDILDKKNIIVPNAYNDGDFIMADEKNFDGINNKIFFMVISRIFKDKDKKEDFKNKVITGSLSSVKNPVNLKNKFDDVVDDLAKKYNREINDEEDLFKKVKKSKEYKQFIDGITEKTYAKGKYRKFTYTTVPNQTTIQQQTTDVKNLYKTENVNKDNKTWDGKIKFL